MPGLQYQWVDGEQVTVDLSPQRTIEEQQVSALAVKSGIYFVARFGQAEYSDSALVRDTLDQLAGRFDSWAAVEHVVSIASVEQLNAANMLQLGTQVTVESTSGKSTTVFAYTYPVAEFNTLPPFLDAVRRSVAVLDAAEGA